MAEAQDHLALALALADAAGAAARRHWFAGGSVGTKADGSALTEADLAIERDWRDAIARACPDHGILGEEFGAEATGRSHVWVLDPIDGTRQFGCGLANWATLIALCRDGVPVLGVIDMPLAGARFVGAAEGSTLNGRPIRCQSAATLTGARMALANPASFDAATRPGHDALLRLAGLTVFDGGSPAIGALARGLADLCLYGPDLDAFDICALVPVVTGAGGRISDWQGGDLGLSSAGAVLASGHPALHDAALAVLKGVR
ncbi:inositol monophosphatase family protein [Frigidibacter oleivorans]|uniref:inositol monophosphatase family protein n=1 Tax=Frigidibacter oleivorans TaxID=2487129 RepID=UPI000F8DEDA7|nr:inositol monophosphatase family protein [Frigidibacter oleivorans]